MSAAVETLDWPEALVPRCHKETGSLGSDVLALCGGSPRVLQGMVEGLATEFRKGWFDLSAGIAVFMAPSRAHAFTSEDVNELIKALCHSNGLAVVAMGDTTITADAGDKSIEPDESFLIGERAARFLDIEAREGLEAALEDVGEEPPDLVVEVEHTHYDPDKIEVYRAVGARELWELATAAAARAPQILDLQAPGGVRPIETSRILAGVRAEGLPEAVVELRAIGGLAEFATQMGRGKPVVRKLLAAAGVVESRKRRSD